MTGTLKVLILPLQQYKKIYSYKTVGRACSKKGEIYKTKPCNKHFTSREG
jgi:hypothetical protein